jgi:lipopolysaccharide transport system permease protein
VPERYQALYALNPIVGIIDGFRASILGGEHVVRPQSTICSIIIVIVLVVTGFVYFRHAERKFADLI